MFAGIVVVLVILSLVPPPGVAEDVQQDGGEDLVPYGALSTSVQARLMKAAEEQPLEPYAYGALSPSVQSRLIRGGDASGAVSARLRLL